MQHEGSFPRPRDGYFQTRDKLLTRRAVLWLGQTCNIRCHFCYFLDRIENKEHPEQGEQAFMGANHRVATRLFPQFLLKAHCFFNYRASKQQIASTRREWSSRSLRNL